MTFMAGLLVHPNRGKLMNDYAMRSGESEEDRNHQKEQRGYGMVEEEG
jgi:hypothetical protein